MVLCGLLRYDAEAGVVLLSHPHQHVLGSHPSRFVGLSTLPPPRRPQAPLMGRLVLSIRLKYLFPASPKNAILSMAAYIQPFQTVYFFLHFELNEQTQFHSFKRGHLPNVVFTQSFCPTDFEQQKRVSKSKKQNSPTIDHIFRSQCRPNKLRFRI